MSYNCPANGKGKGGKGGGGYGSYGRNQGGGGNGGGGYGGGGYGGGGYGGGDYGGTAAASAVGENEISFGEVSSREVLLTVRCKSNQKEHLKALLEQPSTPRRDTVVEKIAAVGNVSTMSPGSKATMDKMETGINTLVAGYTANQDSLKNLNNAVLKLGREGVSLNRRLERMEAERDDEKKEAKRARRDQDEQDKAAEKQHEQNKQYERDKDKGEERWDDDEEPEEHEGNLRSEIAAWIGWKWKTDLSGLKEIVIELGLQGIMNYKSKKKSMRAFCESAYDMQFKIPEADCDDPVEESEA
jgi:hypothetical protein